MLNVGDITAYLKADVSGFQKGIEEAKSGTSSLSGLFSNATAGSEMLLGGVVAVGAALGTVAAIGVKEWMATEDAMKQTEAVLQSTGRVAGVTAETVKSLADAFQRTTKYSDDEVMSAENLLLTFTNISKDIFPQATETVLNMSQALGQDLKSSSIQLGKALQDPILGVTALRRVGVNFNEESQKTIKNLVETGRSGEAQAMILKELQTEFGGSAKAAGETFGGQLVIAKNQLLDFTKIIGKSITDGLKPLIKGFNDWMDSIGGPEGLLKILTDDIAKLKPYLPEVAFAIAFGLIPAFVALGTTIWTALAPLLPFIAAGAAVGWVLNEAAKSVGGWDKMLGIVKQTLTDLWKFLEPVFMPILNAIKAVWDDLVRVLTDFWNKNKDWLIPTLKVLGGILVGTIVVSLMLTAAAILAVLGVIDLLGRAFSWVADQVRNQINIMRQNWEMFKVGVETIANAITGAFRASFNAVARFWNETIGKISFNVPNWVPGIGGKGWSVPNIPYLAEGTDYFQGGLAVVGERGPELVNLPTGSSVTPNSKLGGNTYNIHLDGVMARSRGDLRDIAKDLVEAINEENRAKGLPEMGAV